MKNFIEVVDISRIRMLSKNNSDKLVAIDEVNDFLSNFNTQIIESANRGLFAIGFKNPIIDNKNLHAAINILVKNGYLVKVDEFHTAISWED